MPRNPDEVIRTENEIETLLYGYLRRFIGYRWLCIDDLFIVESPSIKNIRFTISSYINNKSFVLDSLNKFFNSSQNTVITGSEATVTTLDEQSNVDHIQWVNHRLPWEDRDTFRIPSVDGYSNGKSSFNPAWITLVRDVINSISNDIGRTLNYSFVNPYTVHIQDTGQNPTRILDMDIELFSNNILATRHIYNQLGLRGYNQRGTWIPPAISPIPTQREIELGHRTVPNRLFLGMAGISDLFPNGYSISTDNLGTNITSTPSTCIEQEEALDTDYKDDLF